MKINKTIKLIILCIGICFSLSGCQSGEKTGTHLNTVENTTQESITHENITEEIIAEELTESSVAESETPLPSDVEFAFESEDIFCIYNGEKYGYITKSGEEITDCIYDAAYPFSDGRACVIVDGKYGFIDKNGKESIPLIYDDAAPFQEGLAYFALEDTYGFMTKDGTTAFSLDCDSVSSFQEGLAYFCIDGMYGYIDRTGQIVIEASYSDADYFKNGIAFITIDGYKGAIDTKGNIVIPIEYESIKRSEDIIIASIGDATKYYDLTGKELSQKEYEAKINQQTNEILEENDNIDLSDVLLKNSITPKKKLFWNLTHGKDTEVINADGEITTMQKFNTWDEFAYIKKAKFYDADHSGNPILYCYEEPWVSYNFPMSDSAFYSLTDGKIKQLVTGNECGGSLRGDYVCLWKDPESGETLIGNLGAAGGFGGFSNYSSIYHYNAGNAEQVLSYMWIGQVSGNYEADDLMENAHLFYDDNDIPLTQDSIQEADTVNEYIVNDNRVSLEEYQEAKQKYKMFGLYK